ncbi:N-6 DNA methylase [candidate division WOR-3 bacterium]|nr:N-6 DNA methylase [candidate division WOR-3 bacterium]
MSDKIKTETREQFKILIDKFEAHKNQYKKSTYDEANTRVDFIDPFFEAIGWDVANRQGFAEQYREVVREDKVIIVGKHKAPDYSFRIGGIRKFFVEAKKPSVDLKHEISPAYQLRRYAYTAKLPLSILTDFEEFAVYDTRIKPSPKDSASVARIFYCNYQDYLKHLDFIVDTFSKEAILKGSFDRYIESTKKKRGTSEVDKEFLKLIDNWREILAKNIALRNKDLTLYELNFAVQKIIDRVIFLRIAEDRQIEDYGTLQILFNGANTYRRLTQIFLQADDKYNSGLFDFKADNITLNLTIDDRILKQIIKSVYYPDSPYEFSVLDVEILGNIYEQFLGKTIRLTPSHMVKVEEKPEVKKAGGVYYTPKYIVDYIVRNTVNKVIKVKSPKQIEKIKILDPACGSGSFLLGAYQYLIDYHLNWYINEENRKKALRQEKIVQIGKDSFNLTIAEKQRILTNNIFGVDIDRQAVEVSKLSLLLKLLEGETHESTGRLFSYTQLRLLPDLSNNIKCGNSLIGTDYFEGRITDTIDEDEIRKINPFNWEKESPEIFEQGGFDVVIGNPPYIFSRELLGKKEKEYFFQNYKTIWEKPNTFMIFMEKGFKLLNERGFLSYIVPNSWLTVESGKLLRKFLLNNGSFEVLDDLNYYVFENAKVEPTVFSISNIKEPNHKTKTRRIFTQDDFDNKEYAYIKQKLWKISSKTYKIFISESPKIDLLINKILENSGRLGREKANNGFFDVRTGLQAYETGKGNPKQTKSDVKNRIYDYDYKYNDNTHKYIDGVNVKRYYSDWNGKYLLYGKCLSQPRTIDIFNRPRILVREITNKPPYCINTMYFNKLFLNNKSILNILDFNDNSYNLKLLLGQLNSKLISFYYKNRAVKSSRKVFPKIVIKDLRKFPFRIKVNKSIEDRIVKLVEHMVKMQKKYHSARLEQDKKLYKTQIDLLDKQIDSLVYKLYGLTEEEIEIIENSIGS